RCVDPGRATARSAGDPARARGPAARSARGHRAGVLRRLHAPTDREHAAAPPRYREGPLASGSRALAGVAAGPRAGRALKGNPHAFATLAPAERDGLEETLSAYALGALPDAEAAAVLRHLATCPDCRVLALELRATADLLPLICEPAEPSPALKGRVLATVEAARRAGPVPVPAPPATVPPPPPTPAAQPPPITAA